MAKAHTNYQKVTMKKYSTKISQSNHPGSNLEGKVGFKNYLGCLGLLVFFSVCLTLMVGIPLYFIAGNIESMQEEKRCTIEDAYIDGSGGGLRSASTSSTIMIRTEECGVIGFKGDLGTGSTEGAVDLLDLHQGETVIFWLHPYQLPRWTGAVLDAQRIELPSETG